MLVSLNQRWEDVRAQFTAQLDPILGVVADVADWRSRSLLLLPDILLSRLPLESLGVFAQADSLGRDFSLALLHHRLSHVKERPREEKLSATDKGGEKKEGGEMKGGKAAAPEEPGASFQVASMSYLVDLRAEDDPSALPGRRTGKLAEEFKGLLKSVGAGWRGVVGDGDKVAGEDECIALFESSRAMIYMGMGRFGAFVSPKAVAAADLRGCRLSLILDGIMNEELDRRQSSVDLRKAAWELSSEGAFEMACILSLRGVTTVVVNLAASHPDANMHVAKVGVAGVGMWWRGEERSILSSYPAPLAVPREPETGQGARRRPRHPKCLEDAAHRVRLLPLQHHHLRLPLPCAEVERPLAAD